MNHGPFQLNKVRRLIKTRGQTFKFDTPDRNEFGEPNSETVSHMIKGVFHETTSFISKATAESSAIRKKPSPMIMTLWESLEGLRHNDTLKFNGKEYRVIEIKNLAEANLIADISLEEVQTDGKRAEL